MHLEEKLNFNHHVKEKTATANKGIGLIHKLAHVIDTYLLTGRFLSVFHS